MRALLGEFLFYAHDLGFERCDAVFKLSDPEITKRFPDLGFGFWLCFVPIHVFLRLVYLCAAMTAALVPNRVVLHLSERQIRIRSIRPCRPFPRQ